MKATITFNLPEDKDDFIIHNHALDWALTVLDIDNKLREALKYGHEYKTADEALQAVRDELCEIMDSHDVNLDMIK